VPHKQIDLNKTQGKGTFHKQEFTEMKDLIENNHFREVLAEKVKKEVIKELMNAKMKQLRGENGTKSFDLRRKSALTKLGTFNQRRASLGSPKGAPSPLSLMVDTVSVQSPHDPSLITQDRLQTLAKRSGSVILPPLETSPRLHSPREQQASAGSNYLSPSKGVPIGRSGSQAVHSSEYQSTIAAKRGLLEDMKTNKVQEEILDKIHNMRIKAFLTRELENKTKPHMPIINDDVKQVMVQEYYKAKRQLKN
jgi:hypothetical protein